MNNLLTAIMTKCAGTALSTAVGGRIFFENAPEGSEFPYIVFSIVASDQQDTFKDAIEETIVQFSIYSTSKGVAEITTIFEALKTLLDWQSLTVTGDTSIWVIRQGLTTMFDDVTTPTGTVGLRHWAVDYSMMVQD